MKKFPIVLSICALILLCFAYVGTRLSLDEPPAKRLRRRLWWALYTMDKWSFMSAELSTHIKTEDFDVLPLTSSDFMSAENEAIYAEEAIQEDTLHTQSYFYHLVELSIILSDILDMYFSIRASKLMANNFALTLKRAKPVPISATNMEISL